MGRADPAGGQDGGAPVAADAVAARRRPAAAALTRRPPRERPSPRRIAPAAAAARYHRPPMARRLFTLLSALSLLLCVAAVALWLWSYRRGHVVSIARESWPAPDRWLYRANSLHLVEGRWVYHWCREEIDLRNPPRHWSDRYAEQFRRAPHVGARRFTYDSYGVSPLPVVQPFAASTAGWLGFRTSRADVSANRTETYLVGPIWLTVLVPAVLLILPSRRAAFALRRRGRRASGLCATCGYDFRATPGRCPECGLAGGANP
jgi:hypothetical protein